MIKAGKGFSLLKQELILNVDAVRLLVFLVSYLDFFMLNLGNDTKLPKFTG